MKWFPLALGTLCCAIVAWATLPTQLHIRAYGIKPASNSAPFVLTGPLSIGLCCMWLINEGSLGGSLHDATGLTNTLEIGGSPTWTSSPYGPAISSLSGTNYYFLNGGLASAGRMPLGSSLRTVSFLFRMDSLLVAGSPDQAIGGWGQGGGGQEWGMVIGIGNCTNCLMVNTGGFGIFRAWTPDNKWHIFTTVFPPGATKSSSILLYLDGFLMTGGGTVGSDANVNTSQGEFDIGRVFGQSGCSCTVAGAWVWSRALSQSEIQSLQVDPWQMVVAKSLKLFNPSSPSAAAPPFGIISQ